MNRQFSRCCLFAMLGLVSLSMTAEAQTWMQRPPLHFKTDIKFNVYLNVGPDIKRPTAPWYAYFPADPRMIPAPQMSPYPPWPPQFPPPSAPAPDAKDTLKKLGAESFAAAPMAPQWPAHYMLGAANEPVGYAPAQLPSYWYPKR